MNTPRQTELETQNAELRRVQAELATAKKRYFDLYDLAPVGYVTVSEQGLILETNLATVSLLGVVRDMLAGQPVTRFIFPEDHDLCYRHHQALFETGTPQTCDLRMVKPDDTIFWAHLTATVGPDADGVRVCRLVIHDITERKQVEEALHASHELLSRFIKLSPIYAFIKTVTPTENRVLHASDNYQQVLGLPDPEMVGKTMAELFPPDLAAKITADDRAVIASGEKLELETEFNGRIYASLKFPIVMDDKTLLAGYTIDVTERKHTETALKDSEIRYRELFELAVDGLLTGSHDGVILDANRSFCDLLGMPREELVGKTISELRFTRESLEKAPFRFDLLRQGHVVASERTLVRSDGSEIAIEMRTKMMPDGTYQSIYRDVTERKRTDRTLATERERYLNFYHLSPVGYFSLDDEGLILEVNRTSAALLGVRRDALIKQPLSRFIISADLNLYDRCCQQLVGTNRPQTCEVRMVNLAGTLFWAFLDVTIALAVGGVSVRRIVLSDITERQQAGQRLNEKVRNLNQAERIAHLGCWELDETTQELRWSDETFRIFGYAPGAVNPTLELFFQHVYPEERAAMLTAMAAARDARTPHSADYHVIRPDGEIRIVHEQAELFCDEAGRPVKWLGTVLDVTEHSREQAALQASKVRLRQLVAELSRAEEREQQRLAVCLHDDVAQNMALLRMRLGALAATFAAGPAQAELTQACTLLEQILDQTRALVFDLSLPVLQQLGLVAAIAWSGEKLCRDHHLIFVGRDNGEPGHLDKEQKTLLFRCIRELMTNTVKHAKATRLTVAMEAVSDHLRVTVEDDGSGFDVSCLDPQAQTGFGLFSVQERLAVAGGECEVKSAPGGGGTRVTLTFPCK